MVANDLNPSEYTAQELLRQYAGILREPYAGHLAPNSEKSWDVTAGDGRLLQAKSRVIAASATSRPMQFSIFRSWDFDAAIFVLLAAETYEIVAAYEVPASSVQQRANVSAWVGGQRLTLSLVGLAALPGCVDVTARLRAALENLDAAE